MSAVAFFLCHICFLFREQLLTIIVFTAIGDNATIEAVGTPEKVINAFGPEITGQNVEGKVKSMDVKEYDGRTYYQFELDGPHVLITATAAGNRLYLMSVTANGMFDMEIPVLF
jgi:hypothetical protein